MDARKQTDDLGVPHILELGGPDTFDCSLCSLAAGGHIAPIGILTASKRDRSSFLSSGSTPPVTASQSARQFATMSDFLAARGIRPIIDQTFPFEVGGEVYRQRAGAPRFGKRVIAFDFWRAHHDFRNASGYSACPR